jgi:hypothetical protein
MLSPKLLGSCAAWLVASAACTDPGPATYADSVTDPQLPARGLNDLQTWLAAGYYQAWACEDIARPFRSPSPHGRARVCNNDALHAAIAAGTGRFPAGAAAVKEEYDGDVIVGYAVSRKLEEGTTGKAWYWYEHNANGQFANSAGAEDCTGCHGGAARDYVFTLVQ